MHVWALLAQAWVFYPGMVEYDGKHHFGWSQPADFSDDAGLGGGITYALDPALCSTILPQFKEEAAESMLSFSNFGVTFVDCTEITDAFMRAFAMWASNHRVLHFVEVSAACAAEGLGAKTEVYITAGPPETEQQQSFAAYVSPRPARCSKEEFAMDPPPARCRWEAAYGRRTTAGEFIATDYSINYAHMVFSTNVCWYLDNTFCVMFHSLLAAGMDATLILQVVVFFVNALGFIYVRRNARRNSRRAILRVCAILRRPDPPSQVLSLFVRFYRGARNEVHDAVGSVLGDESMRRLKLKAACTGLLDTLEHIEYVPLTLGLCAVFVPPLFYFRIYAPCVQCYDFEAAAAHEIGHLLGFTHGEGGGGEGEGGRRAGAPPARDAAAAEPVQGEQRVVEVDGVESTSGRSCVCRRVTRST